MKKSFFIMLFTSTTLLLSACSSASPDASIIQDGSINKTLQNEENHHEGEANVLPHDDNPVSTEEHEDEGTAPHGHVEASPHDDSDQPPHRH